MRVLLNGLSVVFPISGVGLYTLRLGKALGTLLGSGKIFWFGKSVPDCTHGFCDNKGPVSINHVGQNLKKDLRKIPGLKTLIHTWRNNQFRSYSRRVKPSLYHETNYAPFNFEYGPTVVTVCDLSFIRHPEWHPIDRVKYFENHCVKQISQVEAIITISEFSKGEILTLLNVDPAKISVTPLGVDRNFRPGKKRMQGVPDKYILYLGNLEPRKNLPALLTAYRCLPKKIRNIYPLVVSGARGWNTKKFDRTLRLFQKGEKLILTGYVPQGQLPELYRGASLFVYPSLYEGFGLPVLEAMACGVPVVASNRTSIPEVVGDAGVLIDPHDTSELRDAMLQLLDDEKLRGEMSEKGLERAKLFSWDKCAQETLAIYEKVLGERG
ncbi:MAG: glycosyltransferase family 4 protein [Candidatus Hodarchaeota archaeon]